MSKGRSQYAPYIVLYLLLFVFWLILTFSLSTLSIVLGLFSSLLVTFLISRILEQGIDENITPAFFIRFPAFVLTVLWEVVKANIDVAGIILDPNLPIEPRIFRITVRLKGDLPRTVYAVYINLTPGTAVLDIQDNVFTIQGLAARHEDSFLSDSMEQSVARLFKQKLPEAKLSTERIE